MKKLNFKDLNAEDLNVTELKTEELSRINGGIWIVGALIGGAALSFQLYKFGFDLGREYSQNH